MAVMWCKDCGALLGVREPVSDWSSDRTGLCSTCLGRSVEREAKGVKTEDPPTGDTVDNLPSQTMDDLPTDSH
jgi:hypothetical protein